jgi:hypothetical protein
MQQQQQQQQGDGKIHARPEEHNAFIFQPQSLSEG